MLYLDPISIKSSSKLKCQHKSFHTRNKMIKHTTTILSLKNCNPIAFQDVTANLRNA